MSPRELRAVLGLSGIFGLRMLGMFVVLPVFAIYAEHLPGGDNLMMVGVAIGAYGLTQAILQIPFGWLSDRYGRKPVIYAGLVFFAAGSFVAALGAHIYVVIAGRTLQGAGAISAAVLAMAADLTRDEQRGKAMAAIGSTIGTTFALSLVLGPWLYRLIGMPGIFGMTGLLALAAIGVVYAIVPDPADSARRAGTGGMGRIAAVLRDSQLVRLYCGIFILHAVLMALFIAVPFSLRDAGLPVGEHWHVYLPVMAGSFVLMLPVLLGPRAVRRQKSTLVGAISILLLAHAGMPWLMHGIWLIGVFLLAFFTAFNLLEAYLPALVTRLAPREARGVASGVYASLQFLGAFFGAVAGGYAYGHWQITGVVILNGVLIVVWLAAASGTRVPAPAA